ncbi:MAG: hypothetical protein Q8P88_02190 [Candidatus Jorgensenbacteria bacterium]|nr:hypothetical protein [Candidatus Jorgensenbacteria bacterium]
MESPQKVFLEREEGVDTAIAKIQSFPGNMLHVNLPRNSVFGASPDTFVELKRAVGDFGKTLIIESVDDHILELAGLAGFQAFQPVFARYERAVSDIVPRRRTIKKKEVEPVSLPPSEPPQKISKKPVPKKRATEEEESFFVPPPRHPRIDEGAPPEPEEEKPRPEVRLRKPRRSFRALVMVVLILVAGSVGAWFLLPKATIALTMKKVSVNFEETVVVAADPSSVSGGVVVPGEVLEARANLSLPFQAQNTETVSAKATGKLTVWNGYSSAPQTLVRNTRFESPDKKIFRIEQQVIVPGAKIENSTIVPSSIEVTVVADETGETYNLPPSSGWRIPGFAGRPQYEGFYAEAKAGTKGGYVGERAKPSAAELANARVKLTEALTDALESQFLIILSDRFTALPGSGRFALVSEDVSADKEDTHTFHLFGEATMEQVVFEEPTLNDALITKVGRTLPGELAVKEFSYTLSTSTVDFAKNTLTFSARGEGVFTEPFDADAFRAAVAGTREKDLKAAVFALPGVEAATVSLSPFFVRSVPDDPHKIKVTVE